MSQPATTLAEAEALFHDASRAALPVDECDFVIVGSGAGGGAVARVLAAAGFSVVVLEEGRMPRSEELAVVARDSMTRWFRNQGKQAAFGRATLPLLQGRCVGGTTFVNSAIIWRLPEHILASWRGQHGLGGLLTDAALESAYDTLEREMSVRPVAVGTTAGVSDLLMQRGAAAAGIESRFIRRSEAACRGSGRCLHGCPNHAKQSTTLNYLRRAAEDGAVVVASAKVERVLFAGRRAVGVRLRVPDDGRGDARGRVLALRARRGVILAASAIQSPNLLRQSGVRHPALGQHFMAHPGTTLMGVYNHRVDMWSAASQGYEAFGLRDTLGVKMETINVPPEVVTARLPGAGPRLQKYLDRIENIAAWALALRADAVGYVRPSYVFGDRVHYSITEGDVARLRIGLKRMAEMHFLAGAEEIITGVVGLPEVMTSPDELRLFDDAPLHPNAYSMVATHLFGGCRADARPEAGVVDTELAVRGRERLWVMDASVMPSNTGVNPQHSIMALATVAARRLAAQ